MKKVDKMNEKLRKQNKPLTLIPFNPIVTQTMLDNMKALDEIAARANLDGCRAKPGVGAPIEPITILRPMRTKS